MGVTVIANPLFDISAGPDLEYIPKDIKADLIIFTSQYSVTAALSNAAEQFKKQLSNTTLISIGPSTQAALLRLGYDSYIPDVQTSEGIIKLPIFQNSRHIYLFKGEGGRNSLEENINSAIQKMDVYNVYRRNWICLPEPLLNQIYSADCWILTSLEMANHLIQQSTAEQVTLAYNKLIYVPSKRVKDNLSIQGFNNIIDMQAADNMTIIGYIKQALCSTTPK